MSTKFFWGNALGIPIQKVIKNVTTEKPLQFLIGKAFPCVKKNAARIVVKSLELDQNLTCYFTRDDVYFAFDPEKLCKTGDMVLIKELRKKKTTLITHEVLKIVYPLGDITDPVTGKKCVTTQHGVSVYRDRLDEVIRLYGDNPTRFKYEEAPPRGWQEDKRDFTHREAYIQYHEEEGEEQPYSTAY